MTKNSKWKTDTKIKNGRRQKKRQPQTFKMEDDKKIQKEKIKTTKKSKWKTDTKIQNGDERMKRKKKTSKNS